MKKVEQDPVLHDVQNIMESSAENSNPSSTLSRRVFLERAIGLAAAGILSGGVKSLLSHTNEQQFETLTATVGDACSESEVACMDQSLITGSQTLESSTEPTSRFNTAYPSERVPSAPKPHTPLPPEPSPTPTIEPAVEQTPLPEVASPIPKPAIKQVETSTEVTSEWDLPRAERRKMSYEEYAKNRELFISKLPTLEMLQQMFPSAFFNNVEGQLNHIQYLNETIQLNAQEFEQFAFNTSRINAFRADGMTPRMLVWHWTGDHYNTPDDIIRVLARRGLGVQGYAHHDEQAYRFVPDLGVEVSHSLGLSDFAIGLEVYSGKYDGKNSPLFSLTPGVVKTALYAAVSMMREINLSINHSTLISHMAGDLIFGNPYYDPYEGTFHTILGRKPPHVRKFDQPQEFMNMIVAKAMELDAALATQ